MSVRAADPPQGSAAPGSNPKVKVVVATTVMLSFLSFWRAAAIVLNDLGSSAFYAGGIAEKAVGPAAPWFILAIMLFSYAVRAVYVESCSMFTRGGVYRVVKESLGGTLAKISVSALMFDYVLTGPISGVSAGQYVVGMVAQTLQYLGYGWQPSGQTVNHWAAAVAAVVTVYFWWRNTKGIHESSQDALRIMYVTTAMVVLLIVWGGITLLDRPETRRLPPVPKASNLTFNPDAVGWLPRIAPSAVRTVGEETADSETPQRGEGENRYALRENAGSLLGLLGILIALGHSVLAMSGEESLAQVNRELEHPKHKNLMRAGLVIFVYSMVFTSLVSFLAYALIPDSARLEYKDNLISGIALYLSGPPVLKLFFNVFIVVVGFLMLSGAINTAIIGANGVLNRVSEDGVLTNWFRAPHRRYGTTYRILNLIVVLQLVAIVASRGDTYALGEAYAFGVIWSFVFKALGTMVLRFRNKSPREWKVPFNIQLLRTEIPLGLGAVTAVLFSIAAVNLVTKAVATVAGLAFTAVFFAVFVVCERINERKKARRGEMRDEFQLSEKEMVDAAAVQMRPGGILVPVRDYNTLAHLEWALSRVNTALRDVVVMTAKVLRGPSGPSEHVDASGAFSDYEQLLFSRVVGLAEKYGKPVKLIVVPTNDVFLAVVQTAENLQASEIVAGRSAKMEPDEQARRLGSAWENLPRTRKQLLFKVVTRPGEVRTYYLGAHSPNLTQDDINLIHKLWLEMVQTRPDLHHRDVVRISLEKLDAEIAAAETSGTDVV